MLPLEEEIELIKNSVGLEKDDFLLTQNFAEFDLDSSDVISNLQIFSIVIAILIALPIILLFYAAILFWSNCAIKVLKKISSALFFNIYIRFILEAYLEISVTCLIRFRNI